MLTTIKDNTLIFNIIERILPSLCVKCYYIIAYHKN